MISLMILKGMNGTTEKKGTSQIEKNLDIILKISAVVPTPTPYQLNISMLMFGMHGIMESMLILLHLSIIKSEKKNLSLKIINMLNIIKNKIKKKLLIRRPIDIKTLIRMKMTQEKLKGLLKRTIVVLLCSIPYASLVLRPKSNLNTQS